RNPLGFTSIRFALSTSDTAGNCPRLPFDRLRTPLNRRWSGIGWATGAGQVGECTNQSSRRRLSSRRRELHLLRSGGGGVSKPRRRVYETGHFLGRNPLGFTSIRFALSTSDTPSADSGLLNRR
ncbi:MAG TPA: hypothetical protein PL105_12625, partial [Caldilineaceae bacterium]|nr:hypothetical protein [Caldilineaceae bacterium]